MAMINRIDKLSAEELERVRQIISEAFVSNELFHNWGTPKERREDVLKYMRIYVDFVYEAKELYGNEDLTAFIGLEDSADARIWPRLKMIFRLFRQLGYSRIRSFMAYAKQIEGSNREYASERHLDVLMVCVRKDRQGQGLAKELVRFAEDMADEKGIALLFDTDMKDYADLYEHLGCTLYNTVTADNGVTRYSLVYEGRNEGMEKEI